MITNATLIYLIKVNIALGYYSVGIHFLLSEEFVC